MPLGLDCKLSASSSSDARSSSSGDDEGTSSDDSSSSGGSSSDNGSSDVAQAAASHAEDIDVEDVPTASSAKLVDPSIAAGTVAREQQVDLSIQPNVVRPADLPSDHPDEVHDWRGWPKFPPKNNTDQERAVMPSLPAKVPHVALVNKHEFLLPKMELLIHTRGRFMQPAPSFRLTNLVDDMQYTAWLSFTDALGGKCVGQYSHRDSPHPGSLWNDRVLSFSQLKLYDGFSSTAPPITLKCHNSYRVQVNVGIVNSGHIFSTSVVRQFVGDHFVAVTHFRKKSSLLGPSNKGFKPKPANLM